MEDSGPGRPQLGADQENPTEETEKAQPVKKGDMGRCP